MKDLVSIPIITFNGEKFLEEQLHSIYSQTHKNIEVIACDDCSTDKTKFILEKYHKSHGLKYYINKKNMGINKNFSKAFSLCNGEFIAPSDQDDIWDPTKIETLLNKINDNVLIYSLSTAIDEENKPLDFNSLKKDAYVEGNKNLSFLFSNCISGHTIMFNKVLLPYLNNIPEIIYPDWWLGFVATTYGNISFYNSPLVLYRRHTNQATNEKKEKTTLFSRFLTKDKKKKVYINEIIVRLESFSQLNLLSKEKKDYINQLVIQFKQFTNVYYNKKLEKLLKSKEDELFLMHSNKISKYTKKLSKGIWYYRFRLYI